MLFDLISWIESNQAVKSRSDLRSAIITSLKIPVLLQFHQNPTTNPKITLCPTSWCLSMKYIHEHAHTISVFWFTITFRSSLFLSSLITLNICMCRRLFYIYLSCKYRISCYFIAYILVLPSICPKSIVYLLTSCFNCNSCSLFLVISMSLFSFVPIIAFLILMFLYLWTAWKLTLPLPLSFC